MVRLGGWPGGGGGGGAGIGSGTMGKNPSSIMEGGGWIPD